MTATYTSPLMNMLVPIPTLELGPQWAQDIYTLLASVVDGHNHTVGKGARIPASALDIISNLDFGNAQATGLGGTIYRNLTDAPGTGSAQRNQLYVYGGEVWFNDATGNAVKMTNSGTLNAAALPGSGIAGTGVDVSYDAGTGTYTFKTASVYCGTVACGPISLKDNSRPSGSSVGIAPATGTAGYALTLPAALPASTRILRVASTGVITDDTDVDNSTLEINAGTLNTVRVKDLGIATAKLANQAVTTAKIGDRQVTGAKIAAGTIMQSNMVGTSGSVLSPTGCGQQSVTDTVNWIDINNMIFTGFVSYGRDVVVECVPDPSVATAPNEQSCWMVSGLAGDIWEGEVRIFVDGAAVARVRMGGFPYSSLGGYFTFPPGNVRTSLQLSAGTHAIKIQARLLSGSSLVANYMKLYVVER